MGQGGCMKYGDQQTHESCSQNDAPMSKRSDTNSSMVSPMYSPKSLIKNKSLLINSLMKDFHGETYEHLFSSGLNLEQFEVLKVIGKGSFAKVYLIKKHIENDRFFALKVIKKKQLYDKKQLHHTMQERHILVNIEHPFIVKLQYAFQSPDRIYFVLDYVNGGDMFHHLRKKVRFSEKYIRFYAAEIMVALDHLHQNGYIYRDLKPENILLDSEGHIKITDFGLSKFLDEQKSTNTFCGTPQYLAPEIIKKKGYDHMIDWWSLGILIYEMAVGQPPFNDRSNTRVLQEILGLPFEPKEFFSKSLKQLLIALLDKNPNTRLGNHAKGGIEQIKAHAFFADINWDDCINRKLVPPIKPRVKSPGETKHIDGVFLNEEIRNTPAKHEFGLALLNNMHIDSFTYDGERTPLAEMPKTEYDEDDGYQCRISGDLMDEKIAIRRSGDLSEV